MTPLFLLLCVATGPPAEEGPLLPSQITLGLGGVAVGTLAGGPTFDQLALTQILEGRQRWGELVLEGTAAAAEPARSPLGFSSTFGLRLGWSNARVAVIGGAWAFWAPQSAPVQLLPALRIQYAPGPVVLTLGVFDFQGQAPAHLSVAWGPIELGYVAPLGGQGTIRVPIGDNFGLRFQVIGYTLLGARQLAFTVTGVYGRQGGRWW